MFPFGLCLHHLLRRFLFSIASTITPHRWTGSACRPPVVNKEPPTLDNKAVRVRKLNDAFRRTFAGGQVMMTASLAAEDDRVRAAVLQAVADLDYYDKKLEFGSEDPADPNATTRVLTIGPSSDF